MLETDFPSSGRVAAGRVMALRILLRRPLDIVDDEQIEQPVAVVIEPAAGHGPRPAMNSGRLRNVLKAATAGISIEMAFVDSGDEQIHEAVVVEVRRSGADGVAGARQANLLGYIRKVPTPVVAE